jgi:hypothetical protein
MQPLFEHVRQDWNKKTIEENFWGGEISEIFFSAYLYRGVG